MSSEFKFSFIGSIFLTIFIVVNIVNLFPFQVYNVFFYTNFLNIFLDTSSLLLLGLGISKFFTIRQIESLKISKKNRIEEFESIDSKINKLEKKEHRNYILSIILQFIFVFIFIIQPINLIFLLNSNDRYTNQMINSMDQVFDNQLKKIKKNDIKVTEDEISEKVINKKENINNLELNYERNLMNFIKSNNAQKFNQIKFIVRNALMSLIWALAFLKLSKIKSE